MEFGEEKGERERRREKERKKEKGLPGAPETGTTMEGGRSTRRDETRRVGELSMRWLS